MAPSGKSIEARRPKLGSGAVAHPRWQPSGDAVPAGARDGAARSRRPGSISPGLPEGKLLFLVLVALIGLSPAHARGQNAPRPLPSQPLTVEQAVEYGLQNNRLLKAAGQDVAAAGERVRQTRADFLPRLGGGYRFQHLKDDPIASLGGEGVGERPGGPATFQTGYLNQNRWEVELSQPLFTGFGLTARHNISKSDRSIAGHREEGTRLDVQKDIHRAFFQVLLGEKLAQVARDNVKSLEVQKKNAEASFEQGLTARNDVLKADVAVAQAVQRERAAVKDVTILRSRLNQLLDLPASTRLDLAEEEIVVHQTPDLDHQYVLAEKQRPEVLELSEAVRQAGEGMTAARSRYYPQFSAFAQYYRDGNDFFANNNEFTNEHNAAVGVRMNWNLFEGGKTDASVKEAMHRQLALEERQKDLLRQIRLQVEDAYEQLQVARANIETARTALSQAEENERMTTLQYKEQLVIFLEVLNAQVFLAQTQADYYQSLYGYRIAWADLERAVGGPLRDGDLTKPGDRAAP
ncbi:MAG: TolC family protein [Syntrophobacteraceae bacterium]|nr:TolC family protein [Syntrophobacteraceae bacterium]